MRLASLSAKGPRIVSESTSGIPEAVAKRAAHLAQRGGSTVGTQRQFSAEALSNKADKGSADRAHLGHDLERHS